MKQNSHWTAAFFNPRDISSLGSRTIYLINLKFESNSRDSLAVDFTAFPPMLCHIVDNLVDLVNAVGRYLCTPCLLQTVIYKGWFEALVAVFDFLGGGSV